MFPFDLTYQAVPVPYLVTSALVAGWALLRLRRKRYGHFAGKGAPKGAHWSLPC